MLDFQYNDRTFSKSELAYRKVHYIAEMIPDTPEGIILEAVIEGMAAYYSEQLSQNIRRGQRASAAKAQSTGGNRPLGYKTGPDGGAFANAALLICYAYHLGFRHIGVPSFSMNLAACGETDGYVRA